MQLDKELYIQVHLETKVSHRHLGYSKKVWPKGLFPNLAHPNDLDMYQGKDLCDKIYSRHFYVCTHWYFFKKNMYFKVGIVGTIQQKANNYDGWWSWSHLSQWSKVTNMNSKL